MCDSEDKRSLGALAPKPRKRLPNREGGLLQQIVAVAARVRVAGSQPRECGTMFRQNLLELFLQACLVQDLAFQNLVCYEIGQRVSCRKGFHHVAACLWQPSGRGTSRPE